MNALTSTIFILLTSLTLRAQIEIPDCCGQLNLAKLNTCESEFLNEFFEEEQLKGFQFKDQQVAYISDASRRVIISNQDFYDELRKYPLTDCQLLVLDDKEKTLSGGYDAIICMGADFNAERHRLTMVLMLDNKSPEDLWPIVRIRNIEKPDKIIIPDQEEALTLTYQPVAANSVRTRSKYEYEANITDIKDSLVLIHTHRMNTDVYDAKDRFLHGQTVLYQNYLSSENMEHLDLKYITSITYSTNHTRFFGLLGGSLLAIGLTTTLFVAPIISIDYRNGDFLKDRYFKTAGAGLILSGTGIPLLRLSRNKKQDLVPQSQANKQNPWYLEILPNPNKP